MKKIAVYGSLRTGMYNHSLLENEGANLVSTETLNVPYKMIPYSSFPALIPDNQNNNILMEIYEVNDTVYRRVERLEGYPSFYDKATTTDSAGDTVEFYIIHDNDHRLSNRYLDVENIEDWKDFYNKHIRREFNTTIGD